MIVQKNEKTQKVKKEKEIKERKKENFHKNVTQKMFKVAALYIVGNTL